MSRTLYLDTARMGLMTPSAQAAHREFNRLAAEEGGSPAIEELLTGGFHSWSDRFQRRYPGLASWGGIRHLKNSVRKLIGPNVSRVMLANRGSQLLKLSARVLCARSHRVLTTDLSWPAYQEIVTTEARRAGKLVSVAPLRDLVLRDQASENEVAWHLLEHYRDAACDGLFLPSVSNDGIALPIDRIVRLLSHHRNPEYVVIDGAQEVGHLPTCDIADLCDFYVAGCHKWLGAYHPLGLGFIRHARHHDQVERVRRHMLSDGSMDDPLLNFVDELENHTTHGFGETVSLAPLLSCQGALVDSVPRQECQQADFDARGENADRLMDAVRRTPWRPLRPRRYLRSGILLLESTVAAVQQADPVSLRQRLMSGGISVTTYAGGVLRLSMPKHPLCHTVLRTVCDALTTCS